jgi:hypothetical protein
VSGTVTAIVLGVFALASAVLVQTRQLMREIARTAEEWRKLKSVLLDRSPDLKRQTPNQ